MCGFWLLLSLKCLAQLAMIIQTFFCPEFFCQPLFPTDCAQMLNAAAMVICPQKQKIYTIYTKKVKKTRSHPCCLRFLFLQSLKCWAQLAMIIQTIFGLTSVGREWDHVWQGECVFVVSFRDVFERPYLASCYDVTSGIVAS